MSNHTIMNTVFYIMLGHMSTDFTCCQNLLYPSAITEAVPRDMVPQLDGNIDAETQKRYVRSMGLNPTHMWMESQRPNSEVRTYGTQRF